MRQNIYMKESRRQKRGINLKSLFFISSILSLLFIMVTLWILEGSAFTSSIDYLFSKKNIVVYDTYTLSFDDSIPEAYKEKVISNLEELEFDGKRRFKIKEGSADIELSRNSEDGSEKVFSKNLIPVAHTYSLLDDVTVDTLDTFNIFVLSDVYKLYLKDEYDLDVSYVGSYEELVTKLAESDENIGLVDLGDIDIQVKILEVDEKYYLDSTDAAIPITFFANVENGVDDFILTILSKNIDMDGAALSMDSLVKVNMGGVVAISRGLAIKIDNSGDNGYAARDIGDFLADADLTHVSNEVSFVPGCTSYSGMRFCSRPEYLEILQKSGVDIVELTGNHNNDYGSQYSKETIEIYKAAGMRYFGGGLDEIDASKILYEEVNGTRIAFVGYNYYDTIYRSLALAGETRSGANSYSEEKVKSDVEEARKSADVVIVTFQFQECYSYPDGDVIYPICYKPLSNPDQKEVFKYAIDVGADIVVGTQAHQPQTFELYGDGVIFYGLGNLYFDQSMWIGTRQGLVLSHYFYNGKHIQSRVIPIYSDKSLIPNLATEEQGDLLMELLKDARE